MIEFIITNYNRKSNKTLMVGDHGDDILAAKANNIKSVAYLGGYSGVDSLVKSNPDYIIKEIYELCTLLKDGQADCKI
jgi:phosphoglycolate phosphatase-like HAD superfamily hydrolase